MGILEGKEVMRRSGLIWYLKHFRNYSPVEASRLAILIDFVREYGDSSSSRRQLDEYCRLNSKYPKLKKYIDRAIEFDLGDLEPESD